MMLFSFPFSSVFAKSRASINRNVYQTVELSTENLQYNYIYTLQKIKFSYMSCLPQHDVFSYFPHLAEDRAEVMKSQVYIANCTLLQIQHVSMFEGFLHVLLTKT